MSLMQAAYAFFGTHHFGEHDAKLIFDNDYLSTSNKRAINQHIEWFAGHSVELDDRALAELEQIANAHTRPTHFNRDRDIDV